VPGTYYLKVTDRSVTPHQRQEVRDIEIVSGQTLEKTLSFGGAGILRIKTVKDGQPFEARVDVYRHSDNKSMGVKNTWYRKKPAEFKLVPGIYRVSILDRSVTPHQRQEVRDIEVVSGQTVEKTVSFVAGGTLFIKAVKEGQPFEIYYIKVYDRKTKETKEIRDIEIISGQTMEKTVAF
jgi:Ca-activated chloride channel family protein